MMRVEVIFLTSSDASSIAGNTRRLLRPPSKTGINPSPGSGQVPAQVFRGFKRVADSLRWLGANRRQEIAGQGRADESITSTVLGLRGEYGAPLSPRLTLLLGFDGLLTLWVCSARDQRPCHQGRVTCGFWPADFRGSQHGYVERFDWKSGPLRRLESTLGIGA